VCPLQVDTGPKATLVKEKHVSNDLDHQTFGGGSREPITNASGKEAVVRCRQSLPEFGQDDENTERQTGESPAEDVREWDNDEVCVSQGQDTGSRKQTELSLIEMPLLSQHGEHGSQGQRGLDSNERIEKLDGDYEICISWSASSVLEMPRYEHFQNGDQFRGSSGSLEGCGMSLKVTSTVSCCLRLDQ
jgi:hypothetical protein